MSIELLIRSAPQYTVQNMPLGQWFYPIDFFGKCGYDVWQKIDVVVPTLINHKGEVEHYEPWTPVQPVTVVFDQISVGPDLIRFADLPHQHWFSVRGQVSMARRIQWLAKFPGQLNIATLDGRTFCLNDECLVKIAHVKLVASPCHIGNNFLL